MNNFKEYNITFNHYLQVNEQGTPVVNCNDADNHLKNFKPFNLEEYWGQRFVQNMHISTHGHQ